MRHGREKGRQGMTRMARSTALGILAAAALCWPAAAGAQSTAKPLKVVLLGDSYSAGNGAGDYYGPKDCYRSTTNWAERYLNMIRDEYNVTFVNRACSGGVIANLTNRRRMDSETVTVNVPGNSGKNDPAARAALNARGDCTPRYRDDEVYGITPISASGSVVRFECVRYMAPQIDAVGKDTDLVLFTIGGNDVNFSEIVKRCFAIGFRSPGACRENIGAAINGIGDVGTRTGTFLRTLKGRMRAGAQIAIPTYPVPGEEHRPAPARRLPLPRRLRRRRGDPAARRPRRPGAARRRRRDQRRGRPAGDARRRRQGGVRRPRARRPRLLPQRRTGGSTSSTR